MLQCFVLDKPKLYCPVLYKPKIAPSIASRRHAIRTPYKNFMSTRLQYKVFQTQKGVPCSRMESFYAGLYALALRT